jgi:translation elongation factor EF-4
MNDDAETIRSVLEELKSEYADCCLLDVDDPEAPITERDIVAEIRDRLKAFCRSRGYQVHCEVKPAPDSSIGPERMRTLPRVDVVVLSDKNSVSWLAVAKSLQDKYGKGSIQARFSSIPVEFFHTAVEAKIQSDVADAREDIDNLKMINESNPSCNCFFVLLNARGRVGDHEQIRDYAQRKGIEIIEYTAKRNGTTR